MDEYKPIKEFDEFEKFVLDNRQISYFESNLNGTFVNYYKEITSINAAIMCALAKNESSIEVTMTDAIAHIYQKKGYKVVPLVYSQFPVGAMPYKIIFGDAKYEKQFSNVGII